MTCGCMSRILPGRQGSRATSISVKGPWLRRTQRTTAGPPGTSFCIRAKPQVSSRRPGPGERPLSPIGPQFSLNLCAENSGALGAGNCDRLENAGLTADFYKGDRSVRESGFDITFRYGPYAAGTHHYADVGLNCLLYKAETNLERMSTLLSKSAEAGQWRERASAR